MDKHVQEEVLGQNTHVAEYTLIQIFWVIHVEIIMSKMKLFAPLVINVWLENLP